MATAEPAILPTPNELNALENLGLALPTGSGVRYWVLTLDCTLLK